MWCGFFLTFYFVVLLRAFRALLGALRALLREFKLATQDEYEQWCVSFFNAWKNWRFLFWPSSHNNPSTPFSDPKFIIPNSSYQIHHTNCHVAVVERMGDIKSIPKPFSVFQKKSRIPKFWNLAAIRFWLSMKRKQMFWKWNNSRTRFFLQVVFFFNLVWVIIDFKVFQARIWDLHL